MNSTRFTDVDPARKLFRPAHVRFVESESRDAAFLEDPIEESRFKLNEASRLIWDLLAQPATIEALLSRIEGRVLGPFDEVREDTFDFVTELLDRGLLDLETLAGEAVCRRYLNLLKRALTNQIYPEYEMQVEYLANNRQDLDRHSRARILRDLRYAHADNYHQIVQKKNRGLQLSSMVHTYLGTRRLRNIEYCAERVFADHVAGDFLEAGVCRGGATILMRALQVVHGQSHRITWVADSFQGLPVPEHPVDVASGLDLSESRCPFLSASRAAVEDNFRTYDLLDENVRFIEGWFAESLPRAPVGTLAILRLDADIYKSTRDVLENLYDRVAPGGFVIVDDYWAFDVCRQAVDEFRIERGITNRLRPIDWTATFWRKT